MKRISKLLTCVIALCLAFSTVAFAAESEMSVKEVSDIQQYISDKAGEAGVVPYEPAPPITGATITDILQDTDTGNIYAVVEVTGYGSTFGYINDSRVPLYNVTSIGSPVVTGYIYTFDCGVLPSGTYTFKYMGRSYNSPWNTVTRTVTFTVP